MTEQVQHEPTLTAGQALALARHEQGQHRDMSACPVCVAERESETTCR